MNIDDGTNLFYLVDEFLLFDFGVIGEAEEKAVYSYFSNGDTWAKSNFSAVKYNTSDRYKHYLFSFNNKIMRQ